VTRIGVDNPVLSIDVAEGTVKGPGGVVRLEPRVMSVLIILARYSGHVVSRDDLMTAVWGKTVVSEAALSRCIYQLREQLKSVISAGDATGDMLVETLPKRGYRLRVNVEQSPSDLKVAGPSLLIEIKRRSLLTWGLVAFVAAVIFIVVLALVQ
jgi:DNA-binding winged helix-turn-helix (wHTH) protein